MTLPTSPFPEVIQKFLDEWRAGLSGADALAVSTALTEALHDHHKTMDVVARAGEPSPETMAALTEMQADAVMNLYAQAHLAQARALGRLEGVLSIARAQSLLNQPELERLQRVLGEAYPRGQ